MKIRNYDFEKKSYFDFKPNLFEKSVKIGTMSALDQYSNMAESDPTA